MSGLRSSLGRQKAPERQSGGAACGAEGLRARGERLLRGSWGVNRGLTVLCLMGAAAFVLMLMTVFGEQGIFKVRQLRQDRALLQGKIAEVERETGELRRRIGTLRSGPASYELAAREHLGLLKPGEIVYDFRSNPIR